MLFIIRGLPGSGKSTFAKKLLENNIIDNHVETDMYFMRDGVYTFDETKLVRAHAWCLENVQRYLDNGKRVGVSNTFTRVWEFENYIRYCNYCNVSYTVITCEGNYGNTHGVPEHAIKRMRDRWENWA